MTTYIIPPTVLYIKQHSITGLKYFGKTTRDVHEYNGSGVYWTDHIKKHGKEHIITIWISEPYTDEDDIVEFALAFSKDNNIVESKEWANIIPENGLDGGGNKGISVSAETRQKQSDANKGKTHSAETKQKISDVRKGKPKSTETRQKMSDARRGVKLRPRSAKYKQKLSDANKGKTLSAEHKQKISDAKKGKPGKPHSTETRQKMSGARKGIPIGKKGIPKGPQKLVECPHCGLVGGASSMTRWHFDNCKKKIIG
jgi:hypothetical protein